MGSKSDHGVKCVLSCVELNIKKDMTVNRKLLGYGKIRGSRRGGCRITGGEQEQRTLWAYIEVITTKVFTLDN